MLDLVCRKQISSELRVPSCFPSFASTLAVIAKIKDFKEVFNNYITLPNNFLPNLREEIGVRDDF